jgi:hypothetical protein
LTVSAGCFSAAAADEDALLLPPPPLPRLPPLLLLPLLLLLLPLPPLLGSASLMRSLTLMSGWSLPPPALMFILLTGQTGKKWRVVNGCYCKTAAAVGGSWGRVAVAVMQRSMALA